MLQRNTTQNWKQIFAGKELRGYSPLVGWIGHTDIHAAMEGSKTVLQKKMKLGRPSTLLEKRIKNK
jgi:hypothetical protein